ncbi:hypothetical protein MPER_08881, partial [Moniliophthora perniciosa FA553]
MSDPSGIPADIVQLTGPIFLGNIFNWALFGTLSVQTSFRNDRQIRKAIVATTYVLELLQTVLATKDAFEYFGFGFGNMEALDQVGLIWFSIPVMTGIVQLFFAWRIWVISSSIYIPVVISV